MSIHSERPVPGLPTDLFKIKSNGTFWRYHRKYGRWIMIKPQQSKNPRGSNVFVMTHPDGNRRSRPIRIPLARTVLSVFGQPRPLGCDAIHKDGNKWNNSLDNLFWAPRNSMRDNESLWKHTPIPSRGSASPVSILSEEIVARCREEYRLGATIPMLSDEYGVSRNTMRLAISGKTWAHVPNAIALRSIKESGLKRGSNSATAVLDEIDVVEMRDMRRTGATLTEIAKKFGVSRTTASGAMKRYWTHVPDPVVKS